MRMQSSSESGRVAYCLPIGITSKTKCARLRSGRSLQHPKSLPGRSSLEGQFLCCALSVQELSAKCSRVFVVLIATTAWAMYQTITGHRVVNKQTYIQMLKLSCFLRCAPTFEILSICFEIFADVLLIFVLYRNISPCYLQCKFVLRHICICLIFVLQTFS